jgi:hypothetical protein
MRNTYKATFTSFVLLTLMTQTSPMNINLEIAALICVRLAQAKPAYKNVHGISIEILKHLHASRVDRAVIMVVLGLKIAIPVLILFVRIV